MHPVLIRAMFAAAAASLPASAQTVAPPPYTPLLFNPTANHWVFRAGGVPWICVQDGRCTRLKFERVGDGDLPAANIESLGFAERAFYLAFQHANFQQGRQQVFRCTIDGCAKFELDPGEFAFLGTLSVRQRGATAILAKHDRDPSRSRILLCTDSGCSESAFTRDNAYDLAFLGAARFEGRNRFWLRERAGTVLSCGQRDEDSDRIECERASVSYPEFPGADAGDLDAAALTAAIEDALRRGNIGEAERLLAEAQARFPGQAQWAALGQRLSQLRAERANRLKIEQARRLVTEARRYATAGDFAAAESLLQDAARLVPSLTEIAQARAEFQRLRAERERRFRERSEYVAAIDEAFRAWRLWEAEFLIAEAERRFAGDPAFRAYRARLEQIRAQAEWQGRVRRARDLVGAAREAIERDEFGRADQLLDQAEAIAPGLPDIRQARAELARARIEGEWQSDEIRQLIAAIETALARNRIDLAERLLADGLRRYPRHAAWSGLRNRVDQAKRGDRKPGDDKQAAAKFIAEARAAIQRKDFAAAEKALAEAEKLDRDSSEVKQVRADLERAKREAAGQSKAEQVKKLLSDARAAIQKKDFAGADKLIADAEKLDPNAPEVKQTRAELDRAKRDAAGQEKAEQVKKLVGDARAAIQKKDFAAAEKFVADAEKLDPNSAEVKQVRAELDGAKREAAGQNKAEQIKKLLGDARAAIQTKEFAAAEKYLADAEKLDPTSAEVKQVRAELDRAKREAAGNNKAEQIRKLVAEARAAIQKKDFAAAEKHVAEAEKLDHDAPAVKAVRAELERAKRQR